MYSANFGLDIALSTFPVIHGPFLVLFLQKSLPLQAEPWVHCMGMTCTASSHWNDTGRGLAVNTGNLHAAVAKILKKAPQIPGVHVPQLCSSFICI